MSEACGQIRLHLSDAVIQAFAAHAQAEFPAECCGVVLHVYGGEVVYRQCRNIARPADRPDSFVVDPRDWARAEDDGVVLAVCHSHPNRSANPSMADRRMCEETGLPWFIMGWPSQVLRRVDPQGWCAPLVGREFAYGVLDCYTLVQDYYASELGITLPDFERDEFGWWERGRRPEVDLYRKGFAQAGFVEMPGASPCTHDVILMRLMSDRESHAAVYLGDGVILHHLVDQLSRRDVYGGFWARITSAVLRHRELLGSDSR